MKQLRLERLRRKESHREAWQDKSVSLSDEEEFDVAPTKKPATGVSNRDERDGAE